MPRNLTKAASRIILVQVTAIIEGVTGCVEADSGRTNLGQTVALRDVAVSLRAAIGKEAGQAIAVAIVAVGIVMCRLQFVR